MDGIELRDYKSGDWRAMYALDLLCFAPTFRFSRRAIRNFAEKPGAITLLAETGSEIVGFSIVHIEGQLAYVVTLDVAQAWRNRGIARRLMEQSETRARARGAGAMALHVFTGNADAIRFYHRIGYKQTVLIPAFYGPGQDAFLLQKY